ncbi:hypothetical protein BaRGS_00033729, partial [Batillaria attramentaria]
TYNKTIGCVLRADINCAVRERLFLGSLPGDFLELLYEAGCVPRPPIESIPSTDQPSTTVTTTSSPQPSTTTTSSPQPSTTTTSSPQPSTDEDTTVHVQPSEPPVADSSTAAGPKCDVDAAAICVRRRQAEVDAAASGDVNALASVCFGSTDDDHKAFCLEDNLSGCDTFQVQVVQLMWDKTVRDKHMVCDTGIGLETQLFLRHGVFTSGYFQGLDSRRDVLQCSSCPSAPMLHVQIERTVSPDDLEICEYENDCPGLQKVLETLETCADVHGWTSADNNTCAKLLTFTQCLVDLPACDGESNLDLCQRSLPSALRFLLNKSEWKRCLSTVRKAAEDMGILQDGKADENDVGATGGKLFGASNFTCSSGGGGVMLQPGVQMTAFLMVFISAFV